MGKKWLTETEGYNIITQCDVVRDTLANSPGDGIYQRFRTFPRFILHPRFHLLFFAEVPRFEKHYR